MVLNPYLYFDGRCEVAFNFYKSVLGGEIMYKGRFSEMPTEFPIPDEAKNRIMHITLSLGDSHMLMGSDTIEGHGAGANPGSNMSISIRPDSEQQADDIFNGLAQGGQITFPIQKTFWGAYFGTVTDQFGINWMINFSIPKNQ